MSPQAPAPEIIAFRPEPTRPHLIGDGPNPHTAERDDLMTGFVAAMMGDLIERDDTRECPDVALAEVCQAFRQAVPRAFKELNLDAECLREFEVSAPIPF